jgi:CheY-specific phosphatase CheX
VAGSGVVAATSGLLKDAGCVVYGARLWFDPNSTENMTEAEPFAPLSELERDAIAELANVAMGRAAASLRKMVGSEIVLSVPKVEILDVQALTDEFAP